jgi:hypothetical protein
LRAASAGYVGADRKEGRMDRDDAGMPDRDDEAAGATGHDVAATAPTAHEAVEDVGSPDRSVLAEAPAAPERSVLETEDAGPADRSAVADGAATAADGDAGRARRPRP